MFLKLPFAASFSVIYIYEEVVGSFTLAKWKEVDFGGVMWK